MKKKVLKRVCTFLLALTVAFTSIPFSQTVYAASATESFDFSLDNYNYARLRSLISPYRSMAVNYMSKDLSKIDSALVAGELSYIQYALSYNMGVKADIYDLEGNLLGPLYGRRYMEHVTGSQDGGYVLRPGYKEDKIRQLMYAEYQESMSDSNTANFYFAPLVVMMGIGLTGKRISYSTLRGYYVYHGLEYPYDTTEESTENAVQQETFTTEVVLETEEIPETELISEMESTSEVETVSEIEPVTVAPESTDEVTSEAVPVVLSEAIPTETEVTLEPTVPFVEVETELETSMKNIR